MSTQSIQCRFTSRNLNSWVTPPQRLLTGVQPPTFEFPRYNVKQNLEAQLNRLIAFANACKLSMQVIQEHSPALYALQARINNQYLVFLRRKYKHWLQEVCEEREQARPKMVVELENANDRVTQALRALFLPGRPSADFRSIVAEG